MIVAKALYRMCLWFYLNGSLGHISNSLFMVGHKALYDDVVPSLPDDVWDDACEEDYVRCNDPYWDAGMSWDNPIVWEDEEVYIVYEGECNMCGRERNINDSGYCSQCWQVWNG